jgi:choice-of-anchor B domain-containing protein
MKHPSLHLIAALSIGASLITRAAHAQTWRSEGVTQRSPAIGFGTAVAISGDQVLVGRAGVVPNFPIPPMQTGAVHVFRRGSDGKWVETGTVAPRETALGDGFGAAIAVSGYWMAVSAPGSGERRGAIYLFERDAAGRWTERTRLTATDGMPDDRLGTALAFTGTSLLAGAAARGEQTGSVVAWERNAGGQWMERGRLAGQGVTKGDRFGASISLAGDMALIGAPGPQGGPQAKSGQAFVFRRGGTGGWAESARLAVEDSTLRGLGAAVLIDENEALVSSPGANRGAGVVLQFRREGTRWRETGRIQAASMEAPALFGASLAREGNDLLVGASLSGGNVGSVHVLRRNASGGYEETQKFTTRGIGIGTQLGAALAAGNGIAVAGAPMAQFFEGSAFLYSRPAASAPWTEDGMVADTLTTGLPAITGAEIKCDTGRVRLFECKNADLVAFMPNSALGAKRGIMLNDMWGWTDSVTGREFALVGRLDGTAFIEVTIPANPVYVGELPLHQGAQPNLWRDIKVYKNHAYIVSDGAGPHGVQVFDLRLLLNVRAGPKTFNETAHYDRIHSAHNIAINEETGFAYTTGNSMGGETCGGALHMIDIRDPEHPTFAGCYSDPSTGLAKTGYTHDAQCVIYHGPDEKYRGREICFNSSETAVGIGDVTDKQNPKPISTVTYPNVAYAHQGWLSEDHRYFYLDDEGDELSGTVKTTRTIVFDVADLDDPIVAKEFLGTTPASDHNLYVKGNHIYQSNYVAGLRILDISDPANPREVGYFDTVPFGKDAAGFAGSWSNYPYFKSGVVGVTSMREGFFLIRFRPQQAIP